MFLFQSSSRLDGWIEDENLPPGWMDGWIEDENLPPGWMDGLKMKELQSRNYYCRLLSTNIQNFFVFYSKKNIDLFKTIVSSDILLLKL